MSLLGNGSGGRSALDRAVLDVVNDHAVVVAGFEGDAQEVDEIRVALAQERPVAAAAVHQLRREFAGELGSGLDNEARQPGNAIDFVRLGRDLFRVDLGCGRFTVKRVQEMIAPQRRDALDLVVLDVVPVDAVLHEIKQLLRGATDRGKKTDLVRLEEGQRGGAPGTVSLLRGLVQITKLGFPVVRHAR